MIIHPAKSADGAYTELQINSASTTPTNLIALGIHIPAILDEVLSGQFGPAVKSVRQTVMRGLGLKNLTLLTTD